MRHSKEDIFSTSEKVREIVGELPSVVVLERETYEVVIEGLRVEAAV